MSDAMPKHADCQQGCQMAADNGTPEHSCCGQCQYLVPEATLPTFASRDAAFDWVERAVDDPCVDNYRFAFEDDAEAVAKYQTAKHRGCCGSFDRTVLVAGKQARIGCNYGH